MKRLGIIYLILSLLVLTNIFTYTGFTTKIKELDTANRLLQEQVNQLEAEKKNNYKPQVSMTYTDYGHYNKVLVPKECHLNALPITDFVTIRLIEANTAVPVLDTVISNDNNIWFYVETLALDTPMNLKGWIRESDTVRYTDENRYEARNVAVEEGTPVYEGYLAEHIGATEPVILDIKKYGMIQKTHEEWVRLAAAGGWGFWVNKKDIIYPSVD